MATGSSVFPASSSGSPYTSQPPTNASSVLLDGQMINSASYSTSVTYTGTITYLYANGVGVTQISIGPNTYFLNPGTTLATVPISGTQTTVVSAYGGAPTALSASTLPGASLWVNIKYGIDKFVAIALQQTGQTYYGAYSTNGTSWSAMTLPTSSGTVSWKALAYGSPYWIALSSSNQIGAYSADGITWTATGSLPVVSWNGAAYGNGVYVAVGSTTSVGAYSTNGISWTANTMPFSSAWQKVAYGNGTFVAIADTSNGSQSITSTAAYSNNGITWAAIGIPTASYRAWNDITYANGVFVACQGSGSYDIGYSYDGMTWKVNQGPVAAYWTGVTYGGGYFLIICTNNTPAMYSKDGITWTAASMPSSAQWYKVAYGKGVFAAISYNSTSAAYFQQSQNTPSLFGIYNGPTTTY